MVPILKRLQRAKVHVRAVGRGRLKGLTEEASTEFFEF